MVVLHVQQRFVRNDTFQGEEGNGNLLLEKKYSAAIYEFEHDEVSNPVSDIIKLAAIRQVFNQPATFYSLNYLVRTSKLHKVDVRRLLNASHIFRQSQMLTLKGDEIYYLNTLKNNLKNFWASILYLNYIKYIPWNR